MLSMTYCIMDNMRKTEKNLPLVLFKGSVLTTTAFLGGLTSKGLSKKDSFKTKVLTAIVPRCSVVPMVFLSFFNKKAKPRFFLPRTLHSRKMTNLQSSGICLLWELIWSFIALFIKKCFFFTLFLLIWLFSWYLHIPSVVGNHLFVSKVWLFFFSPFHCLLALYSFPWVWNKSCQAKDCTGDSAYFPVLPSLHPLFITTLTVHLCEKNLWGAPMLLAIKTHQTTVYLFYCSNVITLTDQ